jgi:hypothetical protein
MERASDLLDPRARLDRELTQRAGSLRSLGQAGWLETAPGASISHEFVADLLRDLTEVYQIRRIAFDRGKGWSRLTSQNR